MDGNDVRGKLKRLTEDEWREAVQGKFPEEEKKQQIFIVARNYHVANSYAYRNGILKPEWRYVTDHTVLRQEKNARAILAGDCWNHPDWLKIDEMLDILRLDKTAKITRADS